MADSLWRTLSALHVATNRRRWRLLAHAVEVGPFPATRAAAIARLSRKSGNARTTHAEGLRKAGLLMRERGRPVRYRVTEPGAELYRLAKRILEEPESPRLKGGRLRLDEDVDIVADVDTTAQERAIVLRITNKA